MLGALPREFSVWNGRGWLCLGCMRSHGVPDFPDASAGGGFEIPAGLNTQSPAYTAARQMCTKLLPPPVAQHAMSERGQRQLVAAAKCMRRHGTDIADPTFSGLYITLDVPDQTTIQRQCSSAPNRPVTTPCPARQPGLPRRHKQSRGQVRSRVTRVAPSGRRTSMAAIWRGLRPTVPGMVMVPEAGAFQVPAVSWCPSAATTIIVHS